MTIQGKLLKHLEDSTCWEFPVTKNHVVDSIRDFFKPCSETVACKVFDKSCKCFWLAEENRELINEVLGQFDPDDPIDDCYEATIDDMPFSFSKTIISPDCSLDEFVLALILCWKGDSSGGSDTRLVQLYGKTHVFVISDMYVTQHWVDDNYEGREEE